MHRKFFLLFAGFLTIQTYATREVGALETCLESLVKSKPLSLENFEVLGEGLIKKEVGPTHKSSDGSPMVTVISKTGRVVVTGKSCAQDSDLNVSSVASSMLQNARSKMLRFAGISYQEAKKEVMQALENCEKVEDQEISRAAKASLKEFESHPRKNTEEEDFNRTKKTHGAV